MVIYINGYWSKLTSLLGLSPGTPEESYWNYFSPLFISSSRMFMGVAKDEHSCFIDGSSLFGIDQSAKDRYIYGFKYGSEHFEELVTGLEPGSSFKIISHSEGGAFAAGLADFLLSKNQPVERMLYLSPHQADAFTNPEGVFAMQIHFNNDPICAPDRINNLNVYINLMKLDGKKAGLRYAHGGTVKASTIRKVKRILDKLPLQDDNKLIAGRWTILETKEGFDIKREDELFSGDKITFFKTPIQTKETGH